MVGDTGFEPVKWPRKWLIYAIGKVLGTVWGQCRRKWLCVRFYEHMQFLFYTEWLWVLVFGDGPLHALGESYQVLD
jgi:hypothetical protein